MSDHALIDLGEASYLKGRIGWQGLRAAEFTEDGPYLITGTDFSRGHIDWGTCYHVTEERFAEAAYIHVRDGDLLITKDGTIGKVAYVENAPEKAVLNSGIFLLRCKDGSYQHRYAYYVLTSFVFDEFLRRNLNGSTINHLYQHIFVRFGIPNRPLGEQQKIAAILTSIDTAIEKTEALIEKYQQIKAGLMYDLFTRGVLPNGQLHPPREQATELYQETAIGWLPKDWAVQSAGSIVESMVDGPFGSNLKTEHYVVDPGVRVVRLQNVAEYEYNDADRAYVSDRHANFLLRNKVVNGDVLIAGLGEERYPVGRACCYPNDLSPAINKADCFRVRCRADAIENRFFMLFLNSEPARRQIRRYEQGVTRPRINTGNLKRIDVCVPAVEEQRQIVAKFEAIQSTIRGQQAEAEKLRTKKLGLMQDLLTGRVPVKVSHGGTALG